MWMQIIYSVLTVLAILFLCLVMHARMTTLEGQLRHLRERLDRQQAQNYKRDRVVDYD